MDVAGASPNPSHLVSWIKNSVIGNNKQKLNAINHGVIPRLLQWLVDKDAPQQIRTDAAVVMGSIAKGTPENINTLVEEGCVSVLLKGLFSTDLPFIEACLRCLRTIYMSNNNCVNLIYQDPNILAHMVNILPQSLCTQECVANILANACKMPVLKCLAVIVKDSEENCVVSYTAMHNDIPLPDILVTLLHRDKTSEMQISAAKVLAYMCGGGALSPQDPRIAMKNVDGAETLGYLLETDADLQRTAAVSDHIIKTLADYLKYTDLAAAAIRCLHSLSRSVQLLRTTIQDHGVWKPLMKCILDCGAINILVGLAGRQDPGLRLNGIWGLMNLTFQVEQKVKSCVVEAIGTEQLFRLLSDPDPNIVMKTLGLLRNLLSNKLHIDSIMLVYGNQIMQAVIFILEGEHPPQVKEQTLCILSNVADGDKAKDFIMGNEDVLKKLMNYMLHLNVNLQIAATTCISNLVWNEEEGAYTRQAKLGEMGIKALLQKLLSTTDSVLFEKVKTALQQFT
ncbi:ARMC8-like protein [Mya arenaria]|uniref:Armadillo repeat-containing protein 8 n=1 Tax=Mya arenaria TaxID=6604 RepID=A0ABY7EMP1_MYAAR|nr:ARMC8-like protein [Mya arenaria]